jgi:hypothetical protein
MMRDSEKDRLTSDHPDALLAICDLRSARYPELAKWCVTEKRKERSEYEDSTAYDSDAETLRR